MPNEDVTINAVYLVSTNYIAADGTSQSHAAKQLTSSDRELTSGWYVVNEDVAFSNRIVVSGTVNLILADGKTLTASAGVNVPENSSLIIWGQSSGTGKLTAQPGVSNQAAIGGGNEGGEGVNNSAGTITIYGGKVTATSWAGAGIGDGGTYVEGGFEHGSSGGTVNIYGGTITAQGGMSSAAIGGGSGCTGFAVNIYGGTINATSGAMAAAIGGGYQSTGGTVNIHGGNITANAIDYGGGSIDGFGIGSGPSYKSPTTVNLSWTNTTDRITATSYNGTVKTADGQSFYNGSEVISGTIAASDYATKLDGMTLTPYVTLAAKEATVNDETNYWTTYYCGDAGLAIDDAENACAYTATVSGETITLHKLGKVIPQSTAVIIVGEDASIGMTVSTAPAELSPDNHLHGVDVATPLATVKSTYGADAILMLSNKNQHFGFHDVALTNIPARKAFLAIDDPDPSKARQFTMVFDENTTAINEHESHKSHELSGAWYTLDGRRIANGQKPTAKGLYIVNGKKVIIK
jgi:hypothetical protein